MGNFKRNNRSGGRGNIGGFSDRNSKRSTMHKAVCDECGKDCEVPFKPSGDKPVFCNECFKGKGNVEPRKFSGRGPGRFSSGDKKMHKAVCDKCGKDCEVPFRPTGGRPIYCDQCFTKGDKSKSTDQTSKQFEIINAKLDKILKSLSPAISEEKEEKKKTKIVKPKKISKIKKKKAASPKKVKKEKKK